ncbi:MAG: ABC transporter permease [Oscillatoriales cyanobacterium SM2_1_8]|nr:ABC transporter permease [Oscillatoriales cyanobacterium SM2_1_8]
MGRWTSLAVYAVGRLALAPVSVGAIATVVFLLMRLAPGDPVDAILGGRAPAAVKDALRTELGLSGSLFEQYQRYMGALLRLDLGESLSSRGQKVADIVATLFPATAELALVALVLALAMGVTLGAIAAGRPGSFWDGFSRLFGIVSYALPLFWVGLLLQLTLAVGWGWFPVGGRFPVTMPLPPRLTGLLTVDALLNGRWVALGAALHHLLLPGFCLGLAIAGVFERVTRINLQQALQSDYVEAARARGLPESRIVWHHALPNAAIPIATLAGLTLAGLLGGAVLAEVTFSWPGLAGKLFEAIVGRDYPLVQGIVVFLAAIVALSSLAVDILVAMVDPRIRYF